MLTPHCSAASGIVVPPSIVSTTRLRKSAEYGFAIHAGLLPAGSLNHIRASMGIPDSAFSGNALIRPIPQFFAMANAPTCLFLGFLAYALNPWLELACPTTGSGRGRSAPSARRQKTCGTEPT